MPHAPQGPPCASQRFLADVRRAMDQAPPVTLAEMEALWSAVQMPRTKALVREALVQLAALAGRAAVTLEG